MDLSKILDTIACDLLIAKRHAYYFSNDIIKFFIVIQTIHGIGQTNRKFSSWKALSEEVPQGSVFGTLLFNIY